MTDGIIKGTGNSRYLKSSLDGINSWEEFKAALLAGTLPIDLNGINEAGWQQIGDALNKGNLLSDATAAKLDNVSTPDAAFDLLSRFNGGLGNEYLWRKSQIVVDLGTASNISSATNLVYWSPGVEQRVTYAENALEFMRGNGTVILTTSFASANAMMSHLATVLPGKYYSTSESSGVHFAPLGSVFSVASPSIQIKPYQTYPDASITETDVSYVNSPDPAAYPPAVPDGYTYTSLGQVGGKVQIATGSYTGTGTYGNTNKTSIVFPFAPRFVLICKSEINLVGSGPTYALWVPGIERAIVYSISGQINYIVFTPLENTLSWSSTLAGLAADGQFNATGVKYYYFAIG